MSEHAPLAASGAPQWGHCAGSYRAQLAFPDVETEQSREGTAAHWVCSEVLEAFKRGELVACVSFEGRQAPNGVIIDEKMAEGAQLFVDSVVDTCRRWQFAGDLCIEQRVHATAIHPTDVWGTLDASLYVAEHHVLYIWDYKHGHRDCAAEGNLQLVTYLAGLAERYGLDGIADHRVTVVARIVQPFSYYARGPVKDWVFKLSDLRPYWNKLSAQAHEALSLNPTLTTGLWCRDCKAVGVCSAARMAGYSLIDLVRQPYAMDAMSGHDLAVERGILQDGLAAAKARLEAIEDELQHRLRNGEQCGGLVLEATQGREAWTVPNEQVVKLCGLLGVDATKTAIKTPKQARDAAPKEVRPALIQVQQKTVERKPGKLKLTQAHDTRAASAFKPKSEDF